MEELKPDIAYIDADDVEEERFGNSIKNMLTDKQIKIVSKHRVDDIYPIVGAASIIAKVKRDSILEEYKTKYGEIGSGYTSDARTIRFLKNYIITNKKVPPIVRKSWETTKKIVNEELKNRKITDFFS